MKLKYKITIGNIVVAIMVSFAIFINLTSKDPNDLIGAGYLLFFSIFIFLADLFLQWIIEKSRKLLFIESIALSIIFILLSIS